MAPNIILGASGRPEPPTDIVRRLRAIDPGLSLRFIPGVIETWAITLTFREDDPRREGMRDGSISPDCDYDIIGWLPAGCPLDEAPGYVGRAFGTHPKESVRKMLQRMDEWNEKPPEATQQVEEVVAELSDANFGLDAPKVTGRRRKVEPKGGK